MTREEKELLLKDLCARLPYETKIHIIGEGDGEEIDADLTTSAIVYFESWTVQPYLRPMSSMTEEEEDEFISLNAIPSPCELPNHTRMNWYSNATMLDWLIAHHFDYRGLIEKGLALEAPEGMYKEK